MKDLAGVRVLAFPQSRLGEINETLRAVFQSWTPDPVKSDKGEILAFKYSGLCSTNNKVRGEYQIVSMLIGLFWEVEHAAIYKSTPRLRGVVRSLEMQERSQEVLKALSAFEREFERLVQSNTSF